MCRIYFFIYVICLLQYTFPLQMVVKVRPALFAEFTKYMQKRFVAYDVRFLQRAGRKVPQPQQITVSLIPILPCVSLRLSYAQVI